MWLGKIDKKEHIAHISTLFMVFSVAHIVDKKSKLH